MTIGTPLSTVKLERTVIGFLALVAVACGPGPTPRTEAQATAQKANAATQANGALEAAAKEIDPGPVEPLGPRYPATFRAVLEKSAPTGNKLAAARDLVARLERAQERGRGRFDDSVLANVLEAIHGLEPLVFAQPPAQEAPAAADLLAFLYTLGHGIVDARGSIPRGLRNEREAALDQAGFSKATELLKDGERLARAMAARSLRGPSPTHAFDTLARVRIEAANFEGAKQARLEHLRRSTETPSAFDRLTVAYSCTLALDVPCAEEQIAKAKDASAREGVEAQRGVDGALARLERARTFLKTRDSKTYEDRLAHSRAAIVLSRLDIGKSELPKLVAEAPDDARPLVYQARLRLLQGPGLTEDVIREASAFVDRARAKGKKDDEFYDAALGLHGYLFSIDLAKSMGSATTDQDRAALVERFAEHLRAPVREVGTRDASRGEPLEFLIEIMVAAAKVPATPAASVTVREKFRDAADKAVAFSRKYPRSYEAVAIGRAIGPLARKKDVALAALDLGWPPGTLTWAHARSGLTQRVALGATWDALERIPGEDEIMDGVEDTDDEAGLAHLLAADAKGARAFRTTDAKGAATAWRAAGDAYVEAFANAPVDHRVRLINNAAVAMARAGDEKAAMPLLDRLAGVSDALSDLVALNVAALKAEKNAEQAQTAFAEVFAKTTDPEVAEEAARWLAVLAQKKNDRAGAKKAAEQAIAKKSDAPRAGGTRLTSRKTLMWNFGLTPGRERLSALEIRIDHWVSWGLAAPITDAEVASLAGGAKAAPKKP